MTIICRCGNQFAPRRRWQRFCSPKCKRTAFAEGAGEVRSVRQTKTGWSMTLHFKRQPAVNVGEFLTVMRSERITTVAGSGGQG